MASYTVSDEPSQISARTFAPLVVVSHQSGNDVFLGFDDPDVTDATGWHSGVKLAAGSAPIAIGRTAGDHPIPAIWAVTATGESAEVRVNPPQPGQ